MSTHPAPPPGGAGGARRIGPYAVTGTLGRGGMGIVYRATHLASGRPVALKVLRTPGDARAVARLRRVAQALGKVDHPGVVRVLDVGTTDDLSPYLAIELVEGASLDVLVAGMPVGERLRIVADAARALHAAHEHGVIHRDVKSGNILVAADGTVKVLDFGIGKIVDATTITQLTATGVVVGTLGYMAPEQVTDGADVDRRTDVYGLGATLFDAITGRPPVDPGVEATQALYAILSGTPPPASSIAMPGTFVGPTPSPAAVDAIIARALAKSPAARYETAAELAADIDRARAGETIAAPGRSERGRPSGRTLLVAGGALAWAATLAAGVAIGRLTAPASSPGAVAEAAQASEAGSPPTDGGEARDSGRPPGRTLEERAAPVLAENAVRAGDLVAVLASYRATAVDGLDGLEASAGELSPAQGHGLWLGALLERASIADRAGVERARRAALALEDRLAGAPRARAGEVRTRTEALGRIALDALGGAVDGDPERGLRFMSAPERHPLADALSPDDPARVTELFLEIVGQRPAAGLTGIAEARMLLVEVVRAGRLEVLGKEVPADDFLEQPGSLHGLLEFRLRSMVESALPSFPVGLRARAREAFDRVSADVKTLGEERLIRLRPDDRATLVALGAAGSRWSRDEHGIAVDIGDADTLDRWHRGEAHLLLPRALERFGEVEVEVTGRPGPLLAVELAAGLGPSAERIGATVQNRTSTPIGGPVGDRFFRGGAALALLLTDERKAELGNLALMTRTLAFRASADRAQVEVSIDGEATFSLPTPDPSGDLDGVALRIYPAPGTAVGEVRLRLPPP